jgi:hypothetical protein
VAGKRRTTAAREPAEKSGYSHPRCYANSDHDCSSKISSEHFISRNLLERIELDGKTLIAGLRWQESQTFNSIPTDGVAANVLCEAHNSRLSELDSSIGKFVDDVARTDKGDFSPGKPFRASGSGIERWMLKSLLGMAASKNIAAEPKPECLDLLFERIRWPDGWGLYFDTHQQTIHHTNSIDIRTLAGPTGQLLGARFFLQGLPLTLLTGRPDHPDTFGMWRPAKLVFSGTPAGDRMLMLRWDTLNSGKAITLTRAGTYDGDPPQWPDWPRKALGRK